MNQNPDRIQELFDQAVQLTGEDRTRYLHEACGDDIALLKELESLLEHRLNHPSHIFYRLHRLGRPY